MNIAIIGAGFTGLSAAYSLLKAGHRVTVFEKDSIPGGLAVGFKDAKWEWTLEKHYHHWFTSDNCVLNLAREINFNVIVRRPKTSVFVGDAAYQLDSIKSILSFPHLSLPAKVRMGFFLGLIKFTPYWKLFESITAAKFLPKTIGKKAYEMIWEPQLRNKFGTYADNISMAWFWARIKKRTPFLAYPEGGFLEFANRLVEKIKENGGNFLFNTEVKEIKSNDMTAVKYKRNSNGAMEQWSNFDKVIVTLPSFLFTKITPQLPNEYKNKLINLKGLGAINLVLRLKKQFLTDNTYWLSMCVKNSPLLAIVEHTNFMDKKYYNNEHIVYLGNYLPYDHPYFKMTKKELLKIYLPYLKKINPNFELLILNFELFKVPFAQPIIPINYSKIIPSFETPLKNVYLANIQQVYPWDRGTNYAIELGEKTAKLITNS